MKGLEQRLYKLILPDFQLGPFFQEKPPSTKQIISSLIALRAMILASGESTGEEQYQAYKFIKSFKEAETIMEKIDLTCNTYQDISLRGARLETEAEELITAISEEYGPSKSAEMLFKKPRPAPEFFNEAITKILVPLIDKEF